MTLIMFTLIGMASGGLVSKLIEDHRLGYLGHMLIGIIGAWVGGYAFEAFEIPGANLILNLGLALGGAMAFLMVTSLFELEQDGVV